MKFSLFINKIKNYKNNFININQIIYEELITFFPKLNKEDLNILIILTTFLLNIISNKYFIKENYWIENKQDIKAIVLLLLPYLYDYNFTDLNEILYSFTNCNKISSYILKLNRDDVLKQYFKYSNIMLGIIDNSPNKLSLLDDNNDKLIYKFIEHNLIGLLQTLYIINGKSYINWVNIIPININNYQKSNIYIHTIDRLQKFSENISIEDFQKIESNNLIDYNGLWLGDFYNILRIKYFENFKKINWLLIPINDEKYLINDLNELFKLENILNLEYYNYNDLPQNEQDKFHNIIINILKILNLESYNNLNLINVLNKLLLYFIKNNSFFKEKYNNDENLLKSDIINIFNDIINLEKIDVFWFYLKKNIIINFKDSAYGKFLLTKKNNNYYFNNYFNYKTFSGTKYSINLYILYQIIDKLMKPNISTKDYKYLDLNYISLNIENKFLFFKRIYSEKNLKTWLNLKSILSDDNYKEKMKEIFTFFKEFYVNLVFEELILCGSLSEFISKNEELNPDSIYYLTKDKYLDIAKEAPWQKFYALNWISQIDFFHHYIYHQIIYITGATGQGKTTQVPKLLLYASFVIDYKLNPKIVCSEPRIAPTIDNASRVSDELGVPIFDNLKNKTNNYYIQYKYKNDNHIQKSANGFIKFTTDGTILEEIINKQLLYENNIDETKIYNKVLYDICIIDEAHEHGVNMDILIPIIRNACYINNKIKLIIISATMDSDEPIYRRFFKNINDNLSYPIKNELNHPFDDLKLFLPQPIYMDRRYHISPPSSTTRYEIIDNYLNIDLSLEEAEEEGVKKTLEICSNTINGGILFFTIGKKEIFNIVKELNIKLPIDCIALPLFGELDRKYSEIISKININLYNIQYKKELIHEDWGPVFVERKDVQKGTYKRFVIVATNIAEASVTIPDLKYVIDTGFSKLNIYSYDTNTSNMITQKISEVNRIQRRGRVGRINSGIVYYMYKYKSRENVKLSYKITESNIDNTLLKLISNVKFLNKSIDPNIFSSYENIFLINNELDNNNNLIKIFQENYYINNKIISEIYFNISVDTDIFYQGYSLDILKDITGEFYLIHPCENSIHRNILNKIINKFTNNYIINNLLINNLICQKSNNKTDLGLKIMKFGKEEINLNNRLCSYYASKYNCVNEIKEIQMFLDNINYSLLELSNVDWTNFTAIYNNYNSDIEFIFELIQKIKLTFNNLLNDIINLKTKTNILITIETIKNNFIFNKKNIISIELKNKLQGLINNGIFNNKYKSIIFNDSIIQNIFKKSIISENIIEWTDRNLFKNNKILNFLNKLIANSFDMSKEVINIIPIEIYSSNRMKLINEIYLLSYKNQIVYPYKNLTCNNISYVINYDKISKKSITVSKISYYEIIYISSKLELDNKINISIIINK